MKIDSILNRIKTSPIGYRIASGAFWSFTGTALAKVIVLTAGILCAHILTKDDYGKFNMVKSTVTMFAVLGTGGLGLTASKYISQFKINQKERISSIYNLSNLFAIIIGIAVVALILCLAPFLAEHSLSSPELTDAIRVGALLLFVTVLNGSQSGTLSGLEDFKHIAINTLFGSLAEAALMLIGALYFGVIGAVLGYGSGYIILYLCNHFAIKKRFQSLGITIKNKYIDKKDLCLLYKFSLPAALSSMLVGPIIWISKSILVNCNGYSELAAYEAADQWRMMILFVPSAVSQVVLPILSSMSEGKDNKYWIVFKINLILNAGIALMISLIVMLLSPYIMQFYGESYVSDSTILVILAISTIFSSIANVVGLAISSRAKMWTGFLFNLVWGVMLVGFVHLFTSVGYGAIGLAYAYTLSYIIHSIFQLIYLSIIVKK